MRVYGLLITKEDHEAFGDWCRDQLPLYEHVICLDGSERDATEHQARVFSDRLTYLHERQFEIPSKGDHGLRRVVHEELVRRFGTGIWIMCCHTDEFCYHDPRKIAAKSDGEGYDRVTWLSPHFYPHPSELADLHERLRQPVQERFRHYHWSLHGDGYPWAEDRLYKASPQVYWDRTTHGHVHPHGLDRKAPFYPILRHFKVCGIDLSAFETGRPTTLYRNHWQEQAADFRTGLPFGVTQLEDLFVESVPKYACCSRFEGIFPEPWNMGEEYRPEAPERASREMVPHLAPLLPSDTV